MATEFQPAHQLSGLGAVLAGTPNVIMQLSWPAIGHGVVESTVESGQVTRHPVKRFRTTFTYLSVALLGTDDERAKYRRAVNRAHAQVRSNSSSPVSYNAFDPQLQLWVAACLYWGTVDLITRLHGPLDEASADALFEHGARFGTTLQVPPDLWPADRAAFERYWTEALEQVSIDPTVRTYLHDLITYRYLPRIIRPRRARFSLFVTTGFLPQRFRDEMQLPWDERKQARFDRLLRGLGAVERRMPRAARQFPFNFFLHDVRRRIATGRPLV
jgi:uncharacterized protein (DUF2236 family)